MTTDFTQITFDKEHHTYTYQGQRLQGVTSVVYKLKPPFDPDGSIAERSAAKAGVTVEEIKAKWEAGRKASMERGSRVHEAIAKYLRGESDNTTGDRFLALNDKLPEMRVFEALWAMMENSGDKAHAVEWVIGDAELGIAGTCDLVLYCNIGTHLGEGEECYHLFDWKTGAKFETSNRFGKLLEPFSDLDDCEFNIYSIQLAAYRLMIERNTGRQLGDSYIVHLREDGHQFHKALDLRQRVEAWLKAQR